MQDSVRRVDGVDDWFLGWIFEFDSRTDERAKAVYKVRNQRKPETGIAKRWRMRSRKCQA